MKKRQKRNHFIFILLISLAVMFLFFETQTKVANATLNSSVEIPDESIRLRILANSDNASDQLLKRQIRDEVNKQITTWVGGIEDIEQAREVIKSQLPAIEKIVKQELKQLGAKREFTVDFGKVAFPTKMYGDYVYPAGNYEAVLITLGEGTGANWWCVLFPPLCFLDFENGDAVKTADEKEGKTAGKNDMLQADAASSEEEETVQTKFFLVELFSSLFDALGTLFS
ncbi:stage II sporulation protein R [Fictibacillus aquaticus]|uniref:Stage II sporulation protein R n=1 Tax=Fictibacillus aquaticus TaxID=2021314 RepID=A0A235F7T9_9BACL|nr:stage II sporulation protein R [Fictibacillus aquaticus]OYD57421.1 stage II sporulation protein R [Fictibacillus aquaticus]